MSYYKIYRTKRRNSFLRLFSNLNVTTYLIIANVIIYFLFIILETTAKTVNGSSIVGFLALQGDSLFKSGFFWTLLTNMFMHANLSHLFVNMFSLYFIGNFLETLIGKKRFFWFYMISGIFAGLFFATLAFYFGGSGIGLKIFSSPQEFAVGASGAIFAIAGVLSLLTPKYKVYLIAGPLIAMIIVTLLASMRNINSIFINLMNALFWIYFLISIYSLFSFDSRLRKISLPIEMPFWLLPIVAIIPLVIVGLFINLPIGNTAHFGGFLAGAAYGAYLKIRYKKKTRLISETFR